MKTSFFDAYLESKKHSIKTYELYCKDNKLLIFTVCNDIVISVDDVLESNIHLLPVTMQYPNPVGAIQNWLLERHLDFTRTNGRLLLKELNLDNYKSIRNVLANHSLSLTDCYWTKEIEENLSFSQVSLYRKIDTKFIVDISLSGLVQKYTREMIDNPEITNIGSFNKAWRNIKGQWRLYKSGTVYNYFVELLYYKLAKEMHIPVAQYKFDKTEKKIYSVNITNELKMLTHASLYANCLDLEKLLYVNKFAKQYLQMKILDGIMCNYDRHDYNYGFIQSTETGEIFGMAPLFDHNLCLGVIDKKPESNLTLSMLKLELQGIPEIYKSEVKSILSSFNTINRLNELIYETANEVDLKDTNYLKTIKVYFSQVKDFINNM